MVEVGKEKKQNAGPSDKVYEQRFRMLMKLIRIDRMLRGARIVGAKPQ